MHPYFAIARLCCDFWVCMRRNGVGKTPEILMQAHPSRLTTCKFSSCSAPPLWSTFEWDIQLIRSRLEDTLRIQDLGLSGPILGLVRSADAPRQVRTSLSGSRGDASVLSARINFAGAPTHSHSCRTRLALWKAIVEEMRVFDCDDCPCAELAIRQNNGADLPRVA